MLLLIIGSFLLSIPIIVLFIAVARVEGLMIAFMQLLGVIGLTAVCLLGAFMLVNGLESLGVIDASR